MTLDTRTEQQRRGAELLAQHTAKASSEGSEAGRIRALTCFDALTGLPNRLLFREHLALVLRLAQRQRQAVGVLLADVDDFRRLRHALGHRRSDAVLKAIARRIDTCLRGSDLLAGAGVLGGRPGGGLGGGLAGGPLGRGGLARLAGNEFAIVLSQLAEPQDAERVARRLREAVAEALAVEGCEVFATLSVGIALAPGDGDTADQLLERADLALGRAKELGKDRTQFYNPAMDALATARTDIESGLRTALADGGLLLDYQARVDATRGEAAGCEALLRWRHPQRGVLAPGVFIEVAEQSRLIVPIGRWVLEAACRQSQAWRQAGVPPMPVGVNVSPLQVCRPDFVGTVARALEASGLPPDGLEIEITESALLHDTPAALRALSAVKSLGVRLAIDDFGTGYSSLSWLRDFPFDVLKIDRSFVMRLPDDTRTTAITRGIIDLSRRLGLTVVAEGVETTAQRDCLLDAGCTLMQGFLFARPAAPQQLVDVWRVAEEV